MPETNRRKTPRVVAEVKVDYRTISSFITDYSKDLSQGGVFVRTPLPFNIGERLRIRLTIPGQQVPFALEGVVRWTVPLNDKDREPGMGLEFVDWGEGAREELARYVARVEAERK
jgi:uncharacterized protein (TIGR02266 family)